MAQSSGGAGGALNFLKTLAQVISKCNIGWNLNIIDCCAGPAVCSWIWDQEGNVFNLFKVVQSGQQPAGP